MTLLDAVTTIPRISPPRQSLVAIAGVTTETSDRFISGLTWLPEPLRTEGGGDLGTWKVDASNTAVSGSSISQAATGDSFGVWAAESMTAIGIDWQEAVDRVTRKLTTFESRAVESQLWSDGLGVNQSLELAGSGSVLAGSSGGQTIIRSIGIADTKITETWGRGYVHMRPETFAGAVAATVLHKDGNLWMTPMGNVVIPGAGYSGFSPSGSGGVTVGDDYICVTPVVEVHRSGITITPDRVAEATDRATNTVVVYAMRYFSVLWDYSAGSFHIRATY
jgi:hypothetical protein